jgi:hypothetical protein
MIDPVLGLSSRLSIRLFRRAAATHGDSEICLTYIHRVFCGITTAVTRIFGYFMHYEVIQLLTRAFVENRVFAGGAGVLNGETPAIFNAAS